MEKWLIQSRKRVNLHTCGADLSLNLLGYDNWQSPNHGRIHQWRGGGRNTEEFPRMESNHIQESQYFLQIVKCLDENCCRPLRLNYLEITSESFLPLSVVVTGHLTFKAQLGITPLKIFPKGIPYDYNCPVAQDVINGRLRSVCGLYLASIKKMSSH